MPNFWRSYYRTLLPVKFVRLEKVVEDFAGTLALESGRLDFTRRYPKLDMARNEQSTPVGSLGCSESNEKSPKTVSLAPM